MPPGSPIRKCTKNQQTMATKLSLDLDLNEPASIYGLFSDLPDYRLCFVINNALGLKLCRTEKDRVLYHKSHKVRYSEFHYHEPLRMINWRLTANNGGAIYSEERGHFERSAISLIPGLKTINYFLWYDDEGIDEIHREITTRLKSNPYIRAIQEIDSAKTKNIENLIIEI